MKLTEQMSELIGAIIGDGNIYCKKKYWVEICGHRTLDYPYFEHLQKTIKSELDYSTRLFVSPRAVRQRIYSKEFVFWLKELGIPSGPKAYTVKIPEKILENPDFIRRCIRGIFDTDGFIYIDNRPIYEAPYPRLGITTCSKALFGQLVNVLENYGFKMYLRYDKRGAYDLEIYGQVQLEKWMRLIGSSNPKHLNKTSLGGSVVERENTPVLTEVVR